MLQNFKLVNTEGLTGLNYKGKTIPFDKIDDKLAEELMGKTHVLERVLELTLVEQPVVLSEVTDSGATEATAPTPRRRNNG